MLVRRELAVVMALLPVASPQLPPVSHPFPVSSGPLPVISRGLPALSDSAQGDPARAREDYARALALQTQGNQTAALALLWEASGLAPRDADIQNGLGEALERIGALDAAVDAFGRALEARPGFRKAANNLVLTLVKGGRGPEAVERARAIVASAPDDADAWFTLGLAQSEPDVNGALKTFQHVLDLAPRHALARYNLALILKRIDRTSEAIDELTRAVAIEPRPEAYYALGVIYWQQGEVERAVQALRAALAAEPRYADAYYTLGAVLAARHDWKGAAASLRRAIALRPDLWGARDTLARVLRQLGDESGAKTEVAESERLRRESELEHEAVVWTTTGTRQLEAGDAAGAAERFRRATQVFDRYAPAYYQLGRALDALGQHEAARAAFARARQLNARLVSPVETR